MDEATPPTVPETLATYFRLRGMAPSARSRRRRRRTDDDEGQPFTPGRDPRGLGEVMGALAREEGWEGRLSQEDLLRHWADVAGDETAQHAVPVALAEGTLTVRCDSTAWAKQLHIMRAQILTRIIQDHPQAGVTAIRFLGPDVPSWKWGPRAAPGRGPRDTYG